VSAATLQQLIDSATARLSASSDSPRLDAELLLCHLLNKPRTHLRAWPEQQPDAATALKFQQLIDARIAGHPVAHLTGEREFWSLMLKVTPDTLIPRPDTETLVEAALGMIPADASWSIADLGTGSGAIALAIAHERPHCRIVATDRSAAALAVARENSERLNIINVEFRQGSWCEPLAAEQFKLILSNPPYIEINDPHLQQGDVRFEPTTALSSGADGLDAIRQIANSAASHLTEGGHLCLEHGYNQAEAVRNILEEMGYSEIVTIDDLAGQPRVCCACRA